MISTTPVIVTVTAMPEPERGEREKLQRMFSVNVKRNGSDLDRLTRDIESQIHKLVAEHNARFDAEH